ncbi:phage tail tape measure protein [Serratia marcescens]|uniref:phage tail tape measure protein n=1 Tax=Serratia marcescens TaxID=615 RepID=UPI0024C4B309|nr:phage tail tape measure protein [Serratia marcescens]MDK1707003.1 phage tail tape measure protein [Serratia marcescens]
MQQNLSIKVALAAIDKMTQPLNAARKASQGLATAVKATQDNIKNLERQAKKFDAATTAVKKAAGALEAAREKSKALRMEFGKASERTDEQKAALKALSQEIGKLTRSHQAEVDNLNRVRAGFYRLGVSVREGSSATDQISRRTAQYNAQLEKEEASLKRVTAAQASYDKAKKLQGKLASVGVKSAAAGGAILWGGMHAMHAGFEFDRAYSQTLADAQLTRGSGEGQALRDQAKLLARTTHYSAVQATQGQDALINGGMTAGNARQVLPGVLNMALAAHAELGQAANVGSSIFDAFQINPDQMDRVSDVLVATFTRSKTSLESLGETMKYVGPVARQAGMSLESTSAAAAMLAKNGIEGSMAGTGLKSVINGLYAPAKEGAGVLGMLHIKTVTATGAVRPLVEVLQELYQKTRRFNQGSQLNMFKALFGEQGMGAAQILAESAAKGSFQSFQDYLLKAKGIAAKTSRTMTDNFEGDMQMLHSAWDGLWTQMEEGADSPLRKVVQWVTKVIQGITTWMQAHPKLTSAIVDTALAMGALLAVAGTVLTSLAAIIIPLAGMRLAVALLAGGEGIGALTGALQVMGVVARYALAPFTSLIAGTAALISGAIRAIAIEVVGLATALGAPELAVIAAVGAIVGALFHWWGPVQAWFNGLIARLDDTAKHGNWLSRSLAQFALDVINAFKPLSDFLDQMDRKIGDMIDKSKSFLQKHGWLSGEDDATAARNKRYKNFTDNLMAKYGDKVKVPPVHYGADTPTAPAISIPPSPVSGSPTFGTDVWTPPSQKHKGRSGLGAGGAGADANPNRLGDIVFKQLPAWVALNHGFAQPRVAMNGSALASTALSAPVAKKSVPEIGTNVAGDINVHIHIEGAAHMDRQQLVSDIERQVVGTLNKLKRQKLASLKDRE